MNRLRHNVKVYTPKIVNYNLKLLKRTYAINGIFLLGSRL
jgi:hypothetical protein